MLQARRVDESDQHQHHHASRARPVVHTPPRAQSIATARVIASNGRSSLWPILQLFLERQSSRAFSGEAVSRHQVATLLEAARWAPSSFNEQPWRFVVATRESPGWNNFLSWLSDSNRRWCERAGALVLVVAKADSSPRAPHDFDTGAAWAHLALQAAALGLIAHAVAGFDHERAVEELGIPFSFHALCMVAIGVPGRAADLPERLQSREAASQRRPLQEIAFDGAWKQPFTLTGASR
jgi:nitroreductase